MIANPLLNLRWMLVQRTLANPKAASKGKAVEGLQARIEAIRPILEAAPGVQEDAISPLRKLMDDARGFSVVVKLQVAELVLAYAMVQSLHFSRVQRERELTLEERRFGQVDLDSLMQGALELLRTSATEVSQPGDINVGNGN